MKANRKLVFLTTLVLLQNVCDAYKLLVVFPFPGKSHGILGEGYVKTLLKADHEVTYLAAVPLKISSPKLRQIDLSNNFEIFPTEKHLTIASLLENSDMLTKFFTQFSMFADMLNATIQNDEVQQLMMDPNENFDAVIVEWMFTEVYSGFSAVFGCPLIWSSSMEPHSMVTSLIDENLNPAVMLDHMSNSQMPLNFLDRAKELPK